MSITAEIQQFQDETREGWMPEKQPAPDYGEPWEHTSFRNCIRDRHNVLRQIEDDLRDRSRSCVNACAGMADPAKEIQAMHEAIKEAWIEIQYAEARFAGWALRLAPNDPDTDSVLQKTGEALAKLQPFIKP